MPPLPRDPRRPQPVPRKKALVRKDAYLDRLPYTIKILVPLLLALSAAFWLYRSFEASVATIEVTDVRGQPLRGVKLEVFANLPYAYQESPSHLLGEQDVDAPGTTRLPRTLVSDEALVRVSAPGAAFGVGYCFVRADGRLETVRLAPGIDIPGSLVGFEGKSIEGAMVLAMGGGERGVVLQETRCDAAGTFTLHNLSPTLGFIHVRVLHPGFTIADSTFKFHSTEPLTLTLHATRPVDGRLRPVGDEASQVIGTTTLRIYSLPGVEAKTSADGSFRLDNLPPAPIPCQLIAPTLPATLTHRATTVRAGDTDVELVIQASAEISGTVIDRATGVPRPLADVMHEHGPRGREVVKCDADGRFTIGRVPSGSIELIAASFRKLPRQAAVSSHGKEIVEVASGARITGIVIQLD